MLNTVHLVQGREVAGQAPIQPGASSDRLPRELALSDALLPLEQAVEIVSALQTRLRTVAFHENMLAIGARLDVLALTGSPRSYDAMLRLMVAEASDERPVPRDLQRALHALGAVRHGIRMARAGGHAGLTSRLLGDMQRLLLGGVAGNQLDGLPVDAASLPHHPSAGRPEMQDLERFLTEPPALPLPVRLALVTAWIMLVNPFEEDSLSVALLLLPAVVAADGRLPLFGGAALIGDRDAFDAALQELRSTGGWERWICFFLSRLAEAAATALGQLDMAERSSIERDAAMVSLRSDSTARRLAQLMLGAPVLTVGSAQDMLGVSFQTANAAVATLVRLGILMPHSSNRRNRVFIVNPALTCAPAASSRVRAPGLAATT